VLRLRVVFYFKIMFLFCYDFFMFVILWGYFVSYFETFLIAFACIAHHLAMIL
jgi:hypothetical protein